MATGGRLISRAFKALVSEAAWQAFWTYIFPPLVTLATVAAGIVERQPVMWIIMAASVVFAMSAFGLYAFHAWRFSRTPEHKIAFVRSIVNRNQNGRNKQISLGFAMRSSAEFPIEVELTKLDTCVMSRIRMEKRSLPQKLRVDAKCDFFFTDNPIDITGITDDSMKGECEFELKYGRPGGGKKYDFRWGQILTIPIDPKKSFNSVARSSPDEQIGG